MSLGLPVASCSINGAENDDAFKSRIIIAKEKLGSRVMILGHHYQRDTIVEHADATGDSFTLSNEWFKVLLGMDVVWSEKSFNCYEGTDRKTGKVLRTASRCDLVFGSNSELRSLTELYFSAIS